MGNEKSKQQHQPNEQRDYELGDNFYRQLATFNIQSGRADDFKPIESFDVMIKRHHELQEKQRKLEEPVEEKENDDDDLDKMVRINKGGYCIFPNRIHKRNKEFKDWFAIRDEKLKSNEPKKWYE